LKADLYFRISVIDAGLQLKSHLERHTDITVADAIRQLRAGPVLHSTLDYESALEIDGEEGLTLFCPSSSRAEELRETILGMAMKLKPFWAKVSPFGRDRVFAIMSADQTQCLRYARLLDSTDEAVWRWWDKLASNFRAEKLDRLIEIGRIGEQLSLRFERATLKRLGINENPRWISLEDNLAGYDILSYRLDKNGAKSKAFIEVKATYSADRTFVLTRREWNFAERAGAASEFHFWYLPDQALRMASASELSYSVPTDQGSGVWDQVSLSLRDGTFAQVELSD
jgi:uncharacterized protein DUF3883